MKISLYSSICKTFSPLLITCLTGLPSCLAADDASVRFIDRGGDLGVHFIDEDVQSVGWTDIDGDGWEDLWIAGHYMSDRHLRSKLYRNLEGEGFSNVWPLLHRAPFFTDAHGSYWIDFDRDGDLDLYVVAGGGGGVGKKGDPSLLFRNDQDKLIEIGAKAGIADETARGRFGFPFDFNADGYLDLLVINEPRHDGAPSLNRLFLGTEDQGRFRTHPLTADFAGLGISELLVASSELTGIPERLLKPLETGIEDPGLRRAGVRAYYNDNSLSVSIADLNGDLKDDVVAFQRAARPRIPCYVPAKSSDAFMVILPKPDVGEFSRFRFHSTQPVKFQTSYIVNHKMAVGERLFDRVEHLLLRPFGPFAAPVPVNATKKAELVVSYDAGEASWQLSLDHRLGRDLHFVIEPLSDAVAIQPLGERCPLPESRPVQVWLSGVNGYQAISLAPANNQRFLPAMVLTGDFDNDMDVDLYVVNASAAENLPDIWFENRLEGEGGFKPHSVAADMGYSEPGFFVYELIPAPHAIAGDYDNDGFLDIFVAGRHYYSWMAPRLKAGTPHQLMRNQGNANHWITIDLGGTLSPLGALVEVEAGDRVQRRVYTAGVRGYQQDSRLLHFGLGLHEKADRIRVRWRKGEVRELEDVRANQHLIVSPLH